MQNKEQKVKESDTTPDDSSNGAKLKKMITAYLYTACSIFKTRN